MSKKAVLRVGLIVAIAAAMLLVACGKKAPITQPPQPEPPVITTEPPQDVTTPPTPSMDDDPIQPRWPSDLRELQEELERQGLLGDVFFGYNLYDLRADARDRLAKNAQFMNSPDGRSLRFTVQGHCDERGTNEYNIALGQRRTASAVDYLVSLGVDASRFKLVSYGEERPFCTESNEGCWQRNRRARFIVSGGN